MADDLVVGIDVSAYQPPESLDWVKLRESGVRFVIIKAAEGIGSENYRADEHAANAAAEGIAVGYYAFCRPRLPKYSDEKAEGSDEKASARAQAKQLIANVQGLVPPFFCLWADMETNDGLNKEQLTNFALEFCKTLTDNGYDAGIYAGFYYIQDEMSAVAELAQYPLWIPWYTGEPTGPRKVPPPWTDWAIHQWTDKEILPGFTGPLDANVAKAKWFQRQFYDTILLRNLPEWAAKWLTCLE